MRCPVTSGASDGRRARTGRGTRTGHVWLIASSRAAPSPGSSTQTVSSSRQRPAGATRTTVPLASGGARHRCTRPDAPVASPMTAPPAIASPARTRGTKSKGTGAAPRMPGATYAESVPDSGRSRPSKMLPSSPGPTRIASGSPSPITSLPGRRPVVSS